MIVIFIHRFNDIDHLTPVIYKLAKDTDKEILLLAINPFVNIFNDFRLQFLDDFDNVRIDYLFNYYKPNILYKVLAFIIAMPYLGHNFDKNLNIIRDSIFSLDTKMFILAITRFISGSMRRLISKLNLYQLAFKNKYDENYAEGLIDNLSPSVVIFDHASTSSKKGAIGETPPVKWIIESLKALSIPVISLPHGVPLFLNSPPAYDERKQWIAKDKSDHIVLQNKWWMKECMDSGLDPNKASLHGLPRFCEEWSNILSDIVPTHTSFQYQGKEKLRVVYMDTGPDNYKDNKENAQSMLDTISGMEEVHLIYKPHTRSNRSHLKFNDTVENGTDINSVNLVAWSDVVIGMHSSIMIEVLNQKKIYISPKYFRNFELIYEKYGACFIAESLDDIVSALERIMKDRTAELYPKKNIEDFLIDIVNNGDPDADVLKNYRDFILGYCR